MTANQETQLSRAIDAAERSAALDVSPAEVFNRLRADLVEMLEDDSLILYDE